MPALGIKPYVADDYQHRTFGVSQTILLRRNQSHNTIHNVRRMRWPSIASGQTHAFLLCTVTWDYLRCLMTVVRMRVFANICRHVHWWWHCWEQQQKYIKNIHDIIRLALRWYSGTSIYMFFYWILTWWSFLGMSMLSNTLLLKNSLSLWIPEVRWQSLIENFICPSLVNQKTPRRSPRM